MEGEALNSKTGSVTAVQMLLFIVVNMISDT